jgi:NADH-quinone oxidoreductase subunit H
MKGRNVEAIFNHPWFIPLAATAAIMAVLPLCVAYTVLLERKVLADMQARLGPMRVGPHGLLQTIADAVKLLLKEDIVPSDANQWIFRLAPVISFVTAAGSLAVLPLSEAIHVADMNVGLLVILALGSFGILGIILGGWSSNSHYALLGGLRSAAQLVSYEVALALALISGVMCAGTLSMVEIVRRQQERGIWFVFDNWGLMIVPFMVFFISAIAETNRAPFDLPEAESELVAGYHTEYSAFRWAIYYLAEYAAIFVVSGVAVTVFWGGWLRPFPSVSWLSVPLDYGVPVALFAISGLGCIPLARKLPSRALAVGLLGVGACLLAAAALFLIPAVNRPSAPVFWFLFKLATMLYVFIWLRGTFPRYRYDQLMNIGWKVMIPTALGAILANAAAGMLLSR